MSSRNRIWLTALTCAMLAAAVGCDDGSDSDDDGGAGGGSGGGTSGAPNGVDSGAGGGASGGSASGGSASGGSGGVEPLDNAAKINAFLDGKRLHMTGDDIPTHPNGLWEDVNFGQATQCIHSTEMVVAGGTVTVNTVLGALVDAPEAGDVGTCDRAAEGPALEFASTSHLIENVVGDAECFDFTVTYAAFGQEGRGRIPADRQTVELELFFKDAAIGHRCADGAVGEASITIDGTAFGGDAVQVYRVLTE